MAVTTEGARLTAEHRRAQGRNSARLVRDVLGLWRLLDPDRLGPTLPNWAGRVLDLIGRHRSKSERLALDYLAAFRSAETGTEFVLPPMRNLEAGWRDAAEVSLLVTGPSTVKRLSAAGIDPQQAADRAAPAVAAAAMRHAAGGGRDAIDATILADRLALGYQRITSDKACAFCALLVSRGPVYKSPLSGSRTLRDGKPEPYHDGCGCMVEVVYDADTALPEASARFAALWETSTEGLSGKAARNAFRNAYDAQRRAQSRAT